MEGGITQEEPLVSCPVCLVELPAARINSHLDSCLQLQGEGEDLPSGEVGGRSNSAPKPAAGVGLPPLAQQPCFKKMRLSQSPERRNKDEEPGSDLGSPPVFSLFHRGRNTGGVQMGAPRGAATSPNPGKGEERRVENPEPASDALEPLLRGESLAQKLEGKPLADKLRPSHLGDYVGQNQVLGKETLLRSLVEAHEIPSLILWGPPGCGKTTLARIIANSSKKNGTRFVTLSATSAKTSDVRDVIFQAQNEKRLCKRKTILFIDEIHRFNKSQQDTFLPHVECGTITLIGATTENPSFQVNSALLSRCRVIVLEKLSVEAMEAILMRAVKSLGIQVLSQDEEPTSSINANNSKGSDELLGTQAAQQIVGKLPSVHSKYTGSRRQLAWPFLINSSFRAPSKRVQTGRPPYWAFICLHGGKERLCICIEKRAINTLAYLCDGDARTGLNGLQMAVQARLTNTSHQDNNHECSAKRVVITEDHVKEGLQRSHILYDRAGEEHYNCISALHKSMRGSDENASLYWLARMLEGGEDPLYVARRLVRFASEDIGLADPLALPQAVAAYQGCHFIGMPECEVLLAQCVVYFARAPKSIEVYSAYSNVKACLRDHQGPLPPVPLHLRNAPTRLMKNLGYGKDYKYNPMYKNPVKQEYLPEELKEIDFFTQSKI